MNKVRGMMAAGAAVAALVLVFAGASKVAEAIEHTDGYKVGKVAAFAEICGYISQANQIRTRYSFLPDSDEGYKYWRQYLGKYDAVRSPCGVVKNITDDLLSKSFSESTSATGSGDTAVSVPAEERKKVSPGKGDIEERLRTRKGLYDDYGECILDSMKGVSSDIAASAIIEACLNNFSEESARLPLGPEDARYREVQSHCEEVKLRGGGFTTYRACMAEAQRLATQTATLPQAELKKPLIAPADPSEEVQAAHAATNVPHLVGTWSGYGPLHSSSSRTKCGTARIEMRVFDNAVKGKLRLVSASWLDQASDYPFSGSIDPNGRIRIKGVGLSMTGNVSADGQSMRGEWNASDVACKGIFEVSKKW